MYNPQVAHIYKSKNSRADYRKQQIKGEKFNFV